MALGNFTTWGMEALTEFQEKIKAWVRSLVPAKTSQLVNDGTGRSPYATKAYVDSLLGGSDSSMETLWNYVEDGGGTIKYGTDQNYTLRDSVDNYDFLLIEAIGISSDISINGPSSQFIISTHALKNGKEPNRVTLVGYSTRAQYVTISNSNYTVTYSSSSDIYGLINLYGVKIGSKANSYSTNETPIGKWIDGKTIYRRFFNASYAMSSGSNWFKVYDESFDADLIIKATIFSSYDRGLKACCCPCFGRVRDGGIWFFGASLLTVVGDLAYIEYTKNEG